MTIKFDIASTYDEKISEFELGDITIQQSEFIITSRRDKAPYQNFMLFPTLTNFLYSLRDSISKNQKNITFTALDSSFEFHLEINKDMIILDKKIEVPLNIFLNTVYGASMSLYLNYKGKVDNSNGILDEFKTELDSFKRILF